MDGKLPSGFTEQQFWGMDITLVGTTLPPEPEDNTPSAEDIMNTTPSNSEELYANLDILWKENPVQALTYFLNNWGAMLIFW